MGVTFFWWSSTNYFIFDFEISLDEKNKKNSRYVLGDGYVGRCEEELVIKLGDVTELTETNSNDSSSYSFSPTERQHSPNTTTPISPAKASRRRVSSQKDIETATNRIRDSNASEKNTFWRLKISEAGRKRGGYRCEVDVNSVNARQVTPMDPSLWVSTKDNFSGRIQKIQWLWTSFTNIQKIQWLWTFFTNVVFWVR